jgi:DNA gyrase subunit A
VLLTGGVVARDYFGITDKAERIVGLVPLSVSTPLAIGTRNGVVKRVNPAEWGKQHELSAIALKGDDEVVGAARADDADDLVFVTSDAQLLRFAASNVRPQGIGAGGMAGVRLSDGARVIGFSVVTDAQRDDAVVVTIAEPPSDEALFADVEGSAKLTPLAEYPAKGRGTGGVRAQRFVRGGPTGCVRHQARGHGRVRGPRDGRARLVGARQRPVKVGLRFSWNDAKPSR